MSRWSPWRAVSQLPKVAVRLDVLPLETGGAMLGRRGDQVVIILDRRLSQTQRRCALAHELVHLERGTRGRPAYISGPMSNTVVHEENRVDRIVAERLVPLDELSEFVDRQQELGHGVTKGDVAEQFDVTPQVAMVALRELGLVRARHIPETRAG